MLIKEVNGKERRIIEERERGGKEVIGIKKGGDGRQMRKHD